MHLLFLKKEIVCVCVHMHANVLPERNINFLLPIPSLSNPIPRMREGKTEWNLESSCWERDIFCNQVCIQRTNVLRKLSKGDRPFRFFKLFSNVAWAAPDFCEANRMILPKKQLEKPKESQECLEIHIYPKLDGNS